MFEQSKQRKKQLELYNDYKVTFGTEMGKRVLHDLMSACHMLRPSFVEGNEHASAFREGERNVVLRIMKYVGTDSAKLEEQIKEIERNRNYE